ncbi:protein ABHD14A-like [Actinia tenebrosa]|uniref:Protein ABHD14A-like n=1 Tax=Actinia tenebrosa TaxID=6105 RepID=A0A6P8IMN3_ACTTE|nr:protein ABHD14A-like [Actinia tenebrosa]
MANIPLSVSINWRSIVVGLLVFLGVLYYFSAYHWKLHKHSSKTIIKTQYLNINGAEKGIFYRHGLPEKPLLKVLFLHGKRFSSKTWEDIGTLEFLSKKSYEVLAVDLPAFGNSSTLEAPKSPSDKAKFLEILIQKLDYEHSILVAPSMSGSYAFPYIFNGENAKKLEGFVPIAPVGTEDFTEDQFKKLGLKTLIVYGQEDKQPFVSKAIKKLQLIPDAITRRIDQAGHVCYIDHADEFHSNLEEFLEKLQENKS